MPNSITYPPSPTSALSNCSSSGKNLYAKLQTLGQSEKIFNAIDKYYDFHETMAAQKKTLTALTLMSAPLLSTSVSSSLSIDMACVTGTAMSNAKTCSGAAATLLGTICGFVGTGIAVRGFFNIHSTLKKRVEALDDELVKKLDIPPAFENFAELKIIREFSLLPEDDRRAIRKQLSLDTPDITTSR